MQKTFHGEDWEKGVEGEEGQTKKLSIGYGYFVEHNNPPIVYTGGDWERGVGYARSRGKMLRSFCFCCPSVAIPS